MKLFFELNKYKDGLVVTGGEDLDEDLSKAVIEDLEEDLVIPSELEYEGEMYPVTEIGDFAFSGCTSLTSITIPDSVRKIGPFAFRSCKGLTYISIPDSVKEIGENAFYGCSSLRYVIASDFSRLVTTGITGLDYKYRFNTDKNGLVLVRGIVWFCPNSEVGVGGRRYPVTEIGSEAYMSSQMNVFLVPNTVKKIGERAFWHCRKLKFIIIPDSVTEIGENAFVGCKNLKAIIISDSSLLENAGVPEGVKIVKP